MVLAFRSTALGSRTW